MSFGRFRMDGKVALITGGGNGIGAATGHLMSEAGAAVIVLDRDGDRAQAVAGEIIEKGGRALAVAADVANAAETEAAFRAGADAFGSIDAVVANAAIQRHDRDLPIAEATEDAWEETQAVNLKGVFLTCRAAVRQMLDQGNGGAIVIVSSITALRGGSPNTSYAVSKGGLLALSQTIASRYAAEGIRCNAVCPGALVTTPNHDLHPDATGRAERLAQRIPLGRPGRHDEIAPMITFLCSDASSYATAATFVVDGGFTGG